jgi:hypothetical protein
MRNEQFIFWLSGFAKAVNEEGPTLGQWRIILSELNKVSESVLFSDHSKNTSHYIDPDKWKVTCTNSVTTYKANLPEDNNEIPSRKDTVE